uniref:Uncharacterized protein n=1 Tax=Glossina austeni TaxID=7395 RepID=A0A1A9VLX3_GLOAU
MCIRCMVEYVRLTVSPQGANKLRFIINFIGHRIDSAASDQRIREVLIRKLCVRQGERNDTKCKGEHENNIINGICKATELSQMHFMAAFEKRKDDIEMNVNSPQTTYITTFKFIPS